MRFLGTSLKVLVVCVLLGGTMVLAGCHHPHHHRHDGWHENHHPKHHQGPHARDVRPHHGPERPIR